MGRNGIGRRVFKDHFVEVGATGAISASAGKSRFDRKSKDSGAPDIPIPIDDIQFFSNMSLEKIIYAFSMNVSLIVSTIVLKISKPIFSGNGK
jgi:hypothetical protein